MNAVGEVTCPIANFLSSDGQVKHFDALIAVQDIEIQ